MGVGAKFPDKILRFEYFYCNGCIQYVNLYKICIFISLKSGGDFVGQLDLKFNDGIKQFEIKMDGIEPDVQYKILQLCMMDEKEEEDNNPNFDIKEGYQLFNEPVLETKEEPKINQPIVYKEPKEKMIHKFDKEKSIREFSGAKHYQLFYICPNCGNKGKHYILPGTEEVGCHNRTCKEVMMVRQATLQGFPFHDEWGNYFIAGEFKMTMKDKEDERAYKQDERSFKYNVP